MKSSSAQHELFASSPLPSGFVYQPDFLTPADEELLLAEIRPLPLQEALYKTFTAKRRIVSFGAGYDFASNRPTPAPPLPAFLRAVRERAAAWAGISAAELAQCTVAEYSSGTQLGWHRDVPTFGVVIGISLAAPCRMRFRPYPYVKHARAPARVMLLQPRSIYVLRDDARWRWQHAISPTKALRYSITFRTMALAADRRSPRLSS
jgi:alkylated DNA repair dioxygenase AlkB